MFSRKNMDSVTNENNMFHFIKGLIVASLLSLGLVILLAFCMKWFSISDAFISPITLLIKGLSVSFGAFLAIKGKTKGLLKGLIFGFLYVVVAFLVFSLLAGSFSINISTLLDVLFASLLGGIIGIIKVNKN